MTPRLSPDILAALKTWHDALVDQHRCTAEDEGQYCCIDRLMPGFVLPYWEQQFYETDS